MSNGAEPEKKDPTAHVPLEEIKRRLQVHYNIEEDELTKHFTTEESIREAFLDIQKLNESEVDEEDGEEVLEDTTVLDKNEKRELTRIRANRKADKDLKEKGKQKQREALIKSDQAKLGTEGVTMSEIDQAMADIGNLDFLDDEDTKEKPKKVSRTAKREEGKKKKTD